MKITRRRLAASVGLFAAGDFQEAKDPTGHIESRSPSDPDDVVGVFPYSSDNVEVAVASAVKAKRLWAATSLDERLEVLKRFRDELETRRRPLELRLEREGGRPRWECAREVSNLVGRTAYTVSNAKKALHRPSDDGGFSSLPLGAVAIITPAMLPLATGHQHVVGALAGGNTVIWKPSPMASGAAQRYAEAVRAADIPPGVLNIVWGSDEIGERLAADPKIDALVFIGSSDKGNHLRGLVGGRPDLYQFYHLGAQNTALVTSAAMIELASYEIASSAFLSAGQRCTSTSEVLVEESVRDELVAAITKVTRDFKVGVPKDMPFFGPMLSQARRERFQSDIANAVKAGASFELEGRAPDHAGFFMTPTILSAEPTGVLDPPATEFFGPSLTVRSVRGLGDGIRAINLGRFGRCAMLFSDDGVEWERFASEVDVGAALHNLGSHSISGMLPFAGARDSGAGVRGGVAAIRALTRRVSLQQRESDVVDVWPGTRAPASADEVN